MRTEGADFVQCASRRPVVGRAALFPIVIVIAFLIGCSGPGSDLPSPAATAPPANTRPPATPIPSPTTTAQRFPTVAPFEVATATMPAPSPVATAPIPTAPRGTAAASAPASGSAIVPSAGPLAPAYRIAFVSNGSGSDDIWTVDPDGRRLTNLTKAQKTKGNDSDPQWSPDGRRIAFVSDRDGNSDIWMMNVDGTGARNLTRAPGEDLAPRWSPDGKRIVFSSFRDGDAEIYMMTADGTEVTNLTKSDGDDLEPAWSPDSTRIAFVSERGKRPRALYVLNVDAPKDPTRIAAPACDVSSPTWSPDGKSIAFVSCGGANGQGNVDPLQHVVYTVGSGGGGLVAMSDPKVESGGPAYSPDGTSLAFWTYRTAQQADLTLVTVGTNSLRVIQAPPGVARQIVWAPDGANLAFIGGDFTIGNVIVADVSGLTHNITNHAANDRSPRWSPQKLP